MIRKTICEYFSNFLEHSFVNNVTVCFSAHTRANAPSKLFAVGYVTFTAFQGKCFADGVLALIRFSFSGLLELTRRTYQISDQSKCCCVEAQ